GEDHFIRITSSYFRTTSSYYSRIPAENYLPVRCVLPVNVSLFWRVVRRWPAVPGTEKTCVLRSGYDRLNNCAAFRKLLLNTPFWFRSGLPVFAPFRVLLKLYFFQNRRREGCLTADLLRL